jgi:16S rRNA (adenine1518-N6/adenine1519-N6)-dimethyltransferase
VVEIGPGLGALTRPVLQRCGRLTVIELDRDLAARLRAWQGLEVIEADVLAVDWRAVQPQACRHAGTSPDALMRVVGNLPYNISTPILFHLLEAAAQVQDQHFMLQSEVVDRMVAAPGTKAYGRLSVMLQWRYAMDMVLFVPPESFNPPPRVDSAVVRMVPHTDPASIEGKLLSEIVRVAFSQRRKLLRHTLGKWLQEKAYGGEFDVQRRAEEVPVAEYLALAASL